MCGAGEFVPDSRADGFLTTSDAAALVGVQPTTIRQWRARGYLAIQGLDERRYPLHSPEAVRAAEKRVRESGLNSAYHADPRRQRKAVRQVGEAA